MDDEGTQKLLRELVQLTRVSTYPVARNVLRETFFEGEEPKEKWVRVYARLDGSPQSQIAEAAGVSQGSVSTWSRAWQRLGLVSEDGEAVFDILDFFPELEGHLDED